MTRKTDGEKPMPLPQGSKGNYRVTADETAGKATFLFPEKAELTYGRCEFKTPEELLQYLKKSLGTASDRNSLRGSACRRGKYQKVDKSGNPVLTIGDPILDLVSDDEARIFIGGEPIDLTRTVRVRPLSQWRHPLDRPVRACERIVAKPVALGGPGRRRFRPDRGQRPGPVVRIHEPVPARLLSEFRRASAHEGVEEELCRVLVDGRGNRNLGWQIHDRPD